MFRSNQQVASVVPYNGDTNTLPFSANSEQSFLQYGVYGGEFTIGLCDIGNKWDFLYSCCCPSCAMASARYRLDRSDPCMNCTLLNPALLRWLVRSAYHMPGSPCDDCCYTVFCYPCVINQALQTVKRRGPPHAMIGPYYNDIRFSSAQESDPDCCIHCLTAVCCSCCSMALISEKALKMPCMFAFCCANYCILRNILRYQWHLQGTDFGDDCCCPIAMCCLGIIPVLTVLCTWPYFSYDAMSMWKEAGSRGYTGPYLSLPITENPLLSVTSTPVLPPVINNNLSSNNTPYAIAANNSTTSDAASAIIANTVQPSSTPVATTASYTNVPVATANTSTTTSGTTAMFAHNPVVLTMNSIGVSLLGTAAAHHSTAPQQAPPSVQVQVTQITATQSQSYNRSNTPLAYVESLPYSKS